MSTMKNHNCSWKTSCVFRIFIRQNCWCKVSMFVWFLVFQAAFFYPLSIIFPIFTLHELSWWQATLPIFHLCAQEPISVIHCKMPWWTQQWLDTFQCLVNVANFCPTYGNEAECICTKYIHISQWLCSLTWHMWPCHIVSVLSGVAEILCGPIV